MLRIKFVIAVIVVAVLSISCGNKQTSEKGSHSKDFLPFEIESAFLERTSEIRTYVGDSLYEYINGGAEIYHQYGFEEVAMAYYQLKDGQEYVLDVYQFKSVEGAYGMYSSLVSDEFDKLPFGIEGYYSGGRLEFVKDRYLIRITAYDESAYDILLAMAQYMSEHIPGSTELPLIFSWFPEGEKSAFKKIYAESYLGIKELTYVYTIDYFIEDDTVTLFAAGDDGGGKYLIWSQKLDEMGTVKEKVSDLQFDDNLAFTFEHAYYGKIITGLKNGKLVGMINYSDKHRKNLAAWLSKLPE